MSINDCIFCKINNREIPSKIIYESENIIAFLDIFPLSKGHFLVIPKKHAVKMHEVSNEELQEILGTIKMLVMKAGISNYNVLQNNGKIAHQFVDHAHFHVIPKYSNKDGLEMSWDVSKATDEDIDIAFNMYK